MLKIKINTKRYLNIMNNNTLKNENIDQIESSLTENTSHLVFIDYLRSFLVILVVLHHLALIYGGVPPFYYHDLKPVPPYVDPLAYQVALIFVFFNQAWFMGAFFLLSGYFTPGSFERKGISTFLKTRFLRLGIPILLFIFILGPISSIGYWLMPPALTGITSQLSFITWIFTYPYLLSLGPLWFCAILLFFNIGYAAWRKLRGNEISTSLKETSPITYFRIGAFILLLAVLNYLLRIIVPIGQSIGLSFFSFPTIAYLPQYLSFFILGTIASKYDWFRTLPRSIGIAGFLIAILASFFLFPLAFSGLWFSVELTEHLVNAFGYGSWQSAVYALWDSIFAVGMVIFMITLFRSFFTKQGKLGTFLSQNSYAVYIFHIPIVVILAIALRGIDLNPFLKFIMVSAIGIPLCFFIAFFVRKIPRVSNII